MLRRADPERRRPRNCSGASHRRSTIASFGPSARTHQQGFRAAVERRGQHRLLRGRPVVVEQAERLRSSPACGCTRQPRVAGARCRALADARVLQVEGPAAQRIGFVALRGQARPVAMSTRSRVASVRGGGGGCVFGERRLDAARCMPQRRDREHAVEAERERPHPERARDVPPVRDAQHQHPHDAEQHPADDVAQPVRAEVQLGEPEQRRDRTADHVGPVRDRGPAVRARSARRRNRR